MPRGINTANFEPTGAQRRKLNRFASAYSKYTQTRLVAEEKIESARALAVEALGEALDDEVPRAVLAREIGSQGAVANLLDRWRER